MPRPFGKRAFPVVNTLLTFIADTVVLDKGQGRGEPGGRGASRARARVAPRSGQAWGQGSDRARAGCFKGQGGFATGPGPEPESGLGQTRGQGRCEARVGWGKVESRVRAGPEPGQTRGQGKGGANSNTYQADP